MKKHDSRQHKTIGAVICEYNPFHNGHLWQLKEIRARAGCDFLLCLMSGNFVQRGEPALLDKYDRAEHAVRGGADGVIELPLPFSAANAETFAAGAVRILAALPAVKTLAFGCEGTGEKGAPSVEDILAAARLSLKEPPAFRNALRAALDGGASFAQARFSAFKTVMPRADERLFRSPNNMLAIEYAKAALRRGASFGLLPLPRTGAEDADDGLHENFSSASAIRKAILTGGMSEKIKKNVPDFSWKSLAAANQKAAERWDAMEHHALLLASAEQIAACPDCSEGLENRLRGLAEGCRTVRQIMQEATSRRYTAARLRRILLALTLGFTADDVQTFLQSPPYLNILALNERRADEFLSLLGESGLPLLVRGKDAALLSGEAARCLALNERADKVYRAVCGRQTALCGTRFVKPREGGA